MTNLRALKVLHVSEATQWSGGSAQLIALAAGLREKGFDSALACRPHSALASEAAARGLKVHPLKLRQDYDLLSAVAMARLVYREKIELLHAHHSRSHGVCLLAKLLLTLSGKRPLPILVVSRRVSFAMGKNPFSLWKYRNGLVDSFVAVAGAVKEVLVSAGVKPEKVSVIHSGVDGQRFSPRSCDPALRAGLSLPEGVPVVAKIANASPWKGQTTFLDAAALLARKGVKAHFLLAGRDTDGSWIRGEVARRGLSSSVTLAGFRSDIPEVLACVTLSVNAATQGEGLSGALRESLCAGIPVVASDIAGNRELLGSEAEPFLFPPGDATALADKIQEILERPAQAKAALVRWRKRLESEFSVSQMVEKTAALYRTLT